MVNRARYAALAILVLAAPLFAQSELVIYKEGTKLYHRAGCPILKNATDIVAMTRAQAESRGFKPHADCDPEAKKNAPPAAPVPPRPPEMVFLNNTKYYHRKDCRKLDAAGKGVRAVPLDEAGKTHWPCPDCRPPVRRKSSEPAVPGTGRRGR